MAFRFARPTKLFVDNTFAVQDVTSSSATTTLDTKDRIIIALDFGTTYSGVAYCFCSSSGKPDVVPVVDWLGLEGRTQPKVPTAILYEPKDSTKFKWGGQVNWRDDHVRGVKLLLDPQQTRPAYLPSSNFKSEMKKLPKDVIDVAADFMGAMYNHALEKIATRVPRGYLDLCQKDFVLSVPAVWSDMAKESTMQAAQKAGIFPVAVIKEPEAAALYTFMSQERALSNKEGDCFVVCDAGGGTVDLISYEVVSTQPSLDLAEVVPGIGSMSGSLGLNRRFAEAVQNLIGDEEWFRLKNHEAWPLAERQFDQSIKTAFNGDLEDEYIVNFPGAYLEDDDEERLLRDTWFMSGETVQGARLKRPGKPLKGIFLVGGFGASQYLKARIEKANPDIQVIQPDDAWAAIVKGAALSRLSYTNVVSTKATRHYGVIVRSTYEPITDKGRPTFVDPVSGRLRTDKMWWYILKGQDLKRDQDIRRSVSRHVPKDHSDNDLVFQDKLSMSEVVLAPQHPTSDVRTNCTLTSDLRVVDKSLFTERVGIDGREWLQVKFELVISTREAAMKFWLEYDGKEVGSVFATYE
ncbi:Hsp70 family heat shock protein [Fusarium phyllophilum]|uniref:Hsp70 family heat shock protein n=1 Tax=Fusarium phyllophilum TaxID=47803 RepID=A0A8H5JW25_9HYPO|nr:Hsp70 family heat shock protein [Fusarium phyllophilum]